MGTSVAVDVGVGARVGVLVAVAVAVDVPVNIAGVIGRDVAMEVGVGVGEAVGVAVEISSGVADGSKVGDGTTTTTRGIGGGLSTKPRQLSRRCWEYVGSMPDTARYARISENRATAVIGKHRWQHIGQPFDQLPNTR